MTTVPVPNRLAVPATLAGQQPSARTATLEQLRERLESGEPPEKKATRLSEEEQRLVQQAFQRGLFSVARQLPMKIRVNGRGECGRRPLLLGAHRGSTPGPGHVPGLAWGPLQVPRAVSRPQSHMGLLRPPGSQLTRLTEDCLRQHLFPGKKRSS